MNKALFLLFSSVSVFANLASSSAFALNTEQNKSFIATQQTSPQEQQFAKLMQKAKQDRNYVNVDQNTQQIFSNIRQQAITLRPEAQHWNWQIHGNKTLGYGAQGGNNGKVVLGANLYYFNQFNTDEIAFVVAHEVAHSVLQHKPNQSLKRSESRKTELEADQLALELMAKAGYTPEAGISYLGKMQSHYQQRGLKAGGFMSTHPSFEQRIQAIQVAAPKATQMWYANARISTSEIH